MPRSSPPIAVTGATGALGGRVARRLAERGVDQRLIVRSVQRAPHLPGAEVREAAGYRDADAMAAAMRGCVTLFFVSARESADRVAEHRSVVDAAAAAGVRRIVYVSFYGAAPDAVFTFARDHFATEQYIRASGLAFTFLQDNLYLDFIAGMTSAAGVIAGPAADGRLAAVARDDVADVAAAVLVAAGEHAGQTYRLTGPEAFTLAEAAAELTRVTGRSVTYRAQTRAEAYAARAAYAAAPFEIEGWVSSYLAIASGALATITGDVPALLGRRAQSLADVLAAQPQSWAHLRAQPPPA